MRPSRDQRSAAPGRLACGLALLGLLLGLAIGAPSGATAGPSAASEPKVTFTVGVLNDVDSLNPFTGVVAEATEVRQVMYDTLTIASAKDFSPAPGLATKWKASPDGLTWTYTIRSGVTWSDGVALTAKDVAYTVNRIRKGAYEQTNYGSYVAGVSSVTAPDDRTVVIRTSRPSPVLLRLPIPILPAHIWSKISSDQVKSYQNEVGAVGSGPFVLAERKAGQFLRLTANKDYWGGAPKIDELVYRVYGNADALAQALKQGQIDFADNLDADVWQSLQKIPGIKTSAARFSGFDQVAFNTGAALDNGTPIGDGNPALKDKRVRQALSYAIDRDDVVERALGGHGTPGGTVIPPIYADLQVKPRTPYTFDLTKAGQLLDQAGYRKGADGKRTTPDGKPFTLRMFTRQESAPSQDAGRLVQSWFGQLGLPVTLKPLTEEDLTEQIGQGTFDLFEWGWVVEPDPDFLLSSFTCGQRSYRDGGRVYANLSDSFYCNPEYDQLYARQAEQIDPAERADTVQKMQQILYEDAPYAVLYAYDNLQARSTRFSGFVAQPAPEGSLLFQSGAWSYLKIKQVAARPVGAEAESNDGWSRPVLIGGIAGVAAAGLLIVLVRRRRRRRRARARVRAGLAGNE